MMSVEKLLDRLKVANLKEPKLSYFDQYLVDIDNKSRWKNRKENAVVNDFYASRYELWNNRLIKRVFYVCQKWEHKEKIEYILEVQRYLAGSRKKINKGIYVASFGGIKPIYWKSNFEWEESDNNRMRINYGCSYCTNYISHFEMNSYKSFLEKSLHKYCAFEQSRLDDDELFWYLYQYEKHPQMEMISKMGMMWIVDGNMNSIRWSKKGLAIFGIEDKKELKIVELCKGFGGLKFYKKHRSNIKKYNLDTEHKIFIYETFVNRHFEVSNKLIDYINEQDNKRKCSYAYSTYVSDYIDYIDFCNTLGIPLTSAVKYPKNFKKAHDALQNKITIQKSKKKDNAIVQYVNEVLSKYRYADKKFIITPANSTEDLIIESKELNHCVRTYVDRYAERQTSIFLIRLRDNVLEPFYTLELRDGRINQIRGNHNCDPTADIKKFVLKWAKKFKFETKIYQGY